MGFLTCQIVVDTDIHGKTRSGTLTDGAVLEMTFISRIAKSKSVSTYAKFVTNALGSWAEGDRHALDGIGVEIRGTEFQIDVLQAMRNIDYGSTASYQDLAMLSGYPRAYRAVASVCAKNQIPLILPCHRIIKSDGSIGDYFYGTELKRKILSTESH